MSHILCNAPLKQLNKFSLNEIVTKSLIDDKPYELVLIFPTGKFVKYFKQNYIREYFSYNHRPLSDLKIFTLQTFIQLIFESLGLSENYKLLSDGYRLALFEEAIEKANLKFFKSGSKKISNSILIKLFSLIYGLREDGITLQKLEKDYESIQKSLPEELSYFTDTHRISDVIKVFKNYEGLLSDKYIDFPKLLELTIEKLNNFDNNEFQKKIKDIFGINSTIYFDSFTDFKKPEITFLSFFVKAANPFGIHIDYIFNPLHQNGNGPLFGNLEDIIINLHKAGFHLISLSDSPNEKIHNEDDIINLSNESEQQKIFSDIPGFLRRWLFNTEKDLKNPKLSKYIRILIAENRKDEVKNIARLVRFLINFRDFQPSEICICSRQTDLYSGLFREIFSRYRIPSNITDRFNLAQSPVINAILSILNIVNGSFKFDDFSKALHSPYLCFEDKENSVTIDKSNLLDVAKKLRIRGGYLFGGEKEWIKKFEKSIENIKSSIDLSFKQSKDDYELKKLKLRLDSIKKANDDFQFLYNLFNFKTKKLSVFEFQKIINDIINRFKIFKIIEDNYLSILKDDSDEFWKIEMIDQCENDSKAIKRFMELLEEMTYVTNELYPNLTANIDFYIEKLKTSIINTKYQINEKQNFGVTVTSIEQTRGIPFKVMILCGAIDGEFILKYTPNQFLGIELPESEKRHIHSERMLFYQFLTNTPEFFETNNKLIYITYFKNDDSGEKVRSPFIDALLKISTLNEDGCIIDIKEYINSYDDTFIYSKINSLEKDWLRSISNYDELYYHFSNSESLEMFSGTPLEWNSNIYFIRNYLKKSLINNSDNIDTTQEISNESLNIFSSDKIYSITEFETYAKCAFRYFVKYVLNIEEPEKIDYSISPIEFGSLFHNVLFRFYKEIQANQTLSPDEQNKYQELITNLSKISNNLLPVILYPDKKDYYLSVLIQLTNDELQKIKFDHPFYNLDIENIMGYQNKPGFLEMWLISELEKQSNNWDFLPALFELSFGLTTNEQFFLEAVDIDNHFKLKGKIDRIEFALIDNNICFIIADYKSNLNNIPSLKKILNGITFQMPLYLTAANILFEQKINGIKPFGAVYYNLKPRLEKEKVVYYRCLLIPPSNPIKHLPGISGTQILKSDEEIEDVLNQSKFHAKKIVDNISDFHFPVNPINLEVCRTCNYKSACRIKEKAIITEEITTDTN